MPAFLFLSSNYVNRSSPAINSDGTVIVGSEDGCVYAFGPSPPPPAPLLTRGAITGIAVGVGALGIAVAGVYLWRRRAAAPTPGSVEAPLMGRRPTAV